MKLNVEKMAGVPIAIVLKTTPCLWQVESNPHTTVRLGDPPALPRCFIARDAETKSVQWKELTLAGPPTPKYFEARKVRDQFMALKNEQDFLDFLNRIGTFSQLTEAERLRGWQMRDFIGCQKMFAQFLRRSPETWSAYADTMISPKVEFNVLGIISAFNLASRHTVEFGSRYTIKFHWQSTSQMAWRGARHVAIIETKDVISAILATIEVDHLGGAKFDICARPDCHQSYQITSRHKRKYCSIDCAHLESVRRMRRRQNRKRGKTQAQNGNRLET